MYINGYNTHVTYPICCLMFIYTQGVGKSSMVAQLAELTGHTLVRINLSEHSEISDLLGTDMPIESNSEGSSSQLAGPKFVFCK